MEKKNPNEISICINCYKIRFNEKNKPTIRSLKEVFGTNDLIVIMKDFIKNIDSKKVFKNKKGDRILYLKKTLDASKKDNRYAGIVMKGHNGTETAIDELVKNEVKTINTISKDKYQCIPYFFLMYAKNTDPNEIIVLSQSYKQYGFKEIFEEAFREFTISISNDSHVNFNPLSLASVFEKSIKDGVITKMRFVKYGLHKGTENIVKGDKLKEKNYEVELSIKSKGGFWKIKDSLKYDDASFIEQVKIDDFAYEEAYADIFVAGKKRVVNVTKPKQFSAAYDITQDVKIDDKTNLPDFDDVLIQAIDILNNDLIPYV